MFIPLGTLGNVFTTIIDDFDRASLGTATTTGHPLTQLRQSWTIQSSNYVTSSGAASTYPLLSVDVEQTDQVSGTYTFRYLGNGPAFWITDANNWWGVISNMRVALDRTPVTTCSGSGCPPCSTSPSTYTATTCPPCSSTSTANSCYYCSSGYTLIGTDCYFYDVLDQQYYYNGSAYYGPNASACGSTTTCNAPCTASTTVCNSPCGCSTSYSEYSYYTEIKVLQCVAGTVSTYSTDIIVSATSYDIANVPNFISVVTKNNEITIRPFDNSNVLMGSAIIKNISSPIKGNYAGIVYGGSEYNQNGALSYYYTAGRPTS